MWLSTVNHFGRAIPHGASEKQSVTEIWRGLNLKGRPICFMSVITFILCCYCRHIVRMCELGKLNSIISIHFSGTVIGRGASLGLDWLYTLSNWDFFTITPIVLLFFLLFKKIMKPSWMWALNVTWIKSLWCTQFNLPMQLTEKWIFKTHLVLCMRMNLNCLFSNWELLASNLQL